MKKVIIFIRKNVLLLLFGVILGGFTLVFAENDLIPSSLVTFDKNKLKNNKGIDTNAETVEQALDELYIKADSKLRECPSGYSCNKRAYLPENDTNTYEQSEFVQNLKVGDYIQMTPSGTSFQTDGSKTGYEPQTINPQELTLWRVIRKNTNGTVDVVSEYVSSAEIIFIGALGYQNYIEYLNELASHYENPSYTIGSRYIGYSGQTEYINNPQNFSGAIGSAPWTSNTSLSTTKENELLGAGDMGYETDYNLVKVAYGNTSDSANAYKVGTTSATAYWLASRYFQYTSSNRFYFSARLVSSGYVYDALLCYYSDRWYVRSSSFALRPILTLRADIKTISGDGEKNKPYKLSE